MTPTELTCLYDTFRSRVAGHAPSGCTEISLRLSSDFGDELAFYRLVFWGYALVNEAAKIPLAFLTNLPPLRANNLLRNETSALRTFLAHNLDMNKKSDQKTYSLVHRWFSEACGYGAPTNAVHYGACCVHLGGKLQEALSGAVEACHLLDDPEDGARLVADLQGRIDLTWEAHRFDPIVVECATRLGNPDLDLLAFRSRHLDNWRRVLSEAHEHRREQALEQRIEADFLTSIGNALPRSVRANLQGVAANSSATAAALLLVREARRIGTMTLPQILELVSSQMVRS